MVIENPGLLAEFSGTDSVVKRYVYFLWLDDQVVYVGSTVDLDRRIIQHRSDKVFDRVTYREYKEKSSVVYAIERANIKHHKPFYNRCSGRVLKRDGFCIVYTGRGFVRVDKDSFGLEKLVSGRRFTSYDYFHHYDKDGVLWSFVCDSLRILHLRDMVEIGRVRVHPGYDYIVSVDASDGVLRVFSMVFQFDYVASLYKGALSMGSMIKGGPYDGWTLKDLGRVFPEKVYDIQHNSRDKGGAGVKQDVIDFIKDTFLF